MKKFNSFVIHNENYDLAKKILAEVKKDRNNKDFKELESLLSKSIGLIGMFTRFLFIDNNTIEEIKDVLNKMKIMKPVLNNLPRKLTDYNNKNEEGNYEFTLENLSDDLIQVEKAQKAKKMFNKFPSKQKKLIKEILNHQEMLISLDELPDKEDFITKISRYHTSEELETALKTFLSNAKENSYDDILEKLKKDDGIIVKKDDGNTILSQLLTFNSTKKNFGHTSWCIANTESYFNNYVNKDTKQYAMYDFSKEVDDPMRIVGITVNKNGKITYAHSKNDNSVIGKIKGHLKDNNVELSELQFKWSEIESDLFKDDYNVGDDLSLIFNYDKLDEYKDVVEKHLKKDSDRDLIDLVGNINLDKYVMYVMSFIDDLDGSISYYMSQTHYKKKIIGDRGTDLLKELYNKYPSIFNYDRDFNLQHDILPDDFKSFVMSWYKVNSINDKLKQYKDNINYLVGMLLALVDKKDKFNEILEFILDNCDVGRFAMLLFYPGFKEDNTILFKNMLKKYPEKFKNISTARKTAIIRKTGDMTINKFFIGDKKLTPIQFLNTLKITQWKHLIGDEKKLGEVIEHDVRYKDFNKLIEILEGRSEKQLKNDLISLLSNKKITPEENNEIVMKLIGDGLITKDIADSLLKTCMRYSWDYAVVRTGWNNEFIVNIKEMIPELAKIGDMELAMKNLSGFHNSYRKNVSISVGREANQELSRLLKEMI